MNVIGFCGEADFFLTCYLFCQTHKENADSDLDSKHDQIRIRIQFSKKGWMNIKIQNPSKKMFKAFIDNNYSAVLPYKSY